METSEFIGCGLGGGQVSLEGVRALGVTGSSTKAAGIVQLWRARYLRGGVYALGSAVILSRKVLTALSCKFGVD